MAVEGFVKWLLVTGHSSIYFNGDKKTGKQLNYRLSLQLNSSKQENFMTDSIKINKTTV